MEKSFCCSKMDYFANSHCDIHANPFDCPDCLIYRDDNEYGIIVHDGGTSFVKINFCPWCGASLCIAQ
jgi:hypothetical protein